MKVITKITMFFAVMCLMNVSPASGDDRMHDVQLSVLAQDLANSLSETCSEEDYGKYICRLTAAIESLLHSPESKVEDAIKTMQNKALSAKEKVSQIEMDNNPAFQEVRRRIISTKNDKHPHPIASKSNSPRPSFIEQFERLHFMIGKIDGSDLSVHKKIDALRIAASDDLSTAQKIADLQSVVDRIDAENAARQNWASSSGSSGQKNEKRGEQGERFEIVEALYKLANEDGREKLEVAKTLLGLLPAGQARDISKEMMGLEITEDTIYQLIDELLLRIQSAEG